MVVYLVDIDRVGVFEDFHPIDQGSCDVKLFEDEVVADSYVQLELGGWVGTAGEVDC